MANGIIQVFELPYHEYKIINNNYLRDVSFDWFRIGNVCSFKMSNGNWTASSSTVVYTFPAPYRPWAEQDFLDSYSKLRIKINANGEICCMQVTNDTIIRGTVTYVCH